MKILHTADWHLGAPLQGYGEELRRALSAVPGMIAELVRQENCDLVLLSGDVFDGTYTQHTYRTVYLALKEMAVPVFVTPGNHDYSAPDSPWNKEPWPENVHIFHRPQVESVTLPELSCRIYGAGFDGTECPALLEGFVAKGPEKYAIGVFHGDATQTNSQYNPITKAQVQNSNLDYLALGHIHKGDSFTAGKTLCAWPGCPMGRGYDEQGEKGVYIVTLGENASIRFRPLNTPRFYDLQAAPAELGNVLPPVAGEDYYRVTLIGSWEKPDMNRLKEEYAQFPHLELRDETTRPTDIWRSLGEDTFEGVYFGLLKQTLENAPPEEKELLQLAAELSRKLLDGQEVVLP